jgi:hypothetical protein
MIVGWRFSACKAKGRRSVPAGRLKGVLVPEIFVLELQIVFLQNC